MFTIHAIYLATPSASMLYSVDPPRRSG